MRTAVLEHLREATIVIKCAAVADYRVAVPATQKIKKSGAPMTLALEAAPDILAEVGRLKGDRVLIGFAAETDDLEAEALRKLESKHCDMIVANHVGGAGTGFDSRTKRSYARAPWRGAAKARARFQAQHCRQDPRSDSRVARGTHCQMSPEELRRQLEFYRDLGIKELYLMPEPAVPIAPVAAAAAEPLPSMAPAGDTLLRIREDIGDCTRCRLHLKRNKIVFGSGDEHARMVFVGEGPGADEDEQGLPFVGRAGQLLTQMIEGTSEKEGIPIKRDQVYICNVVKCRPPENRTPETDEMETCGAFLFRQLSVIQPTAICALGSTAAKALLGGKDGVTKLRGRWHQWNGIPLMVTFHPSYLLRPYNQSAKREAWEDLKLLLHRVYD